jgi:AraC-like DNA-binding protein
VIRRIRYAEHGHDGPCAPSRTILEPNASYPQHDHADFAEAMWVESGSGRQETGGVSRPLIAGDIWFLGPGNSHRIVAGPQGLTVANIAFANHALTIVRTLDPGAPWPWPTPVTTPVPLATGSINTRRLSLALDDLPSDTSLADLLWILGLLLRTMAMAEQPTAEMPPWLAPALAEMTPEDLATGPSALARRAGVGLAHLNRTIRHIHRCRTTDLINRERCARLAIALRHDNRPVLTLAFASGFSDLSGAYRVFRSIHGCAPGIWRQRFRSPG